MRTANLKVRKGSLFISVDDYNMVNHDFEIRELNLKIRGQRTHRDKGR